MRSEFFPPNDEVIDTLDILLLGHFEVFSSDLKLLVGLIVVHGLLYYTLLVSHLCFFNPKNQLCVGPVRVWWKP